MAIFTTQGLSGNMLLLFTLLVWLMFILILLANRHNRLNRWCFISGMCFSLGVLKEYLYYSLYPALVSSYGIIVNDKMALEIYSWLTAIQYFFSLPTAMMFGFYFNNFNQRHPRMFVYFRIIIFIIPLFIHLIYPFSNTQYLKLNNFNYYLMATLYNWFYGICFTLLLLLTLRDEKRQQLATYRQKSLVSLIVLIPIWYWLISVFLVHILNIQSLFKVWQGNILVIVILLIVYVYNVFKDGIWGSRLYREIYDWTNQNNVMKNNANFISHLIKNETTKMNWCISLLKDEENKQVIEVMERSINHLANFVEKNNWYAHDVTVNKEYVDIKKLLESCIKDKKELLEGIKITLLISNGEKLYCDKEHIYEVISNIVNNAVEAINENGEIMLVYLNDSKKRISKIIISDNGCGVSDEDIIHLFEPYHTTKSYDYHFGLGLYYCQKVMEKHRGKIEVKSQLSKGTTFTLYFPNPRKRDVND